MRKRRRRKEKSRYLKRIITLPVSRVFVSTRTTSSWWATSFTFLGRLGYNIQN